MENATRIIGITGNIATGKSVVRNMLANLGVLGMDADVIAHRVIYPDGGAYQPVITAFGEDILNADGTVSRPRLGQIVFQDPHKLQQLEALIHPAVTRAVQARLHPTSVPLASVEAIKLLESDLAEMCDAVWVSHASEEVQLSRLMGIRGLSEDEARTRMAAQPSQTEKIARADVVIATEGTFQDTWDQICSALNDTIQLTTSRDASPLLQQESLANLDARWTAYAGQDGPSLYAVMGRQMVLHTEPDGLALWDNHSFTAAMVKVLPPVSADLLARFQTQAKHQACELLMIPQGLAAQHSLHPGENGFELLHPSDLAYPDWLQSAERALAGSEGTLWVKHLAQPVEKLR